MANAPMIVPNIASPASNMQRRVRKPAARFALKFRPYELCPIMIHPVLAGETLKSAMLMAKSVSAPVKNDLLGASLEYYFYYVPLRYLRDEYKDMVVDPAFTASSLASADDAKYFFAADATATGIPYAQECHRLITNWYFRDQDDAQLNADGSPNLGVAPTYMGSQYPMVKVPTKNVMHSLKPATEYATADVDITVGVDDQISASEIMRAQAMYQMLMSQGMIDMSYEDYLRSYGIRQTKEENKIPQEIRVIREWVMPRTLVEPSTGVPTNRWEWSVQDRIDKARFFKEPGFVVGYACVRPKVYFRNMKGTVTSFMKNGLSWLPAEVLNSLAYGLPEFAAAKGIHEASSVAYIFDLRDLLQYGEDFVNFDLASTSDGIVALPSADCTNTKYVSTADVQALFSGTDYNVRMDGVLNMNIASRLGADLTPDA